jgi:hypothetical protein
MTNETPWRKFELRTDPTGETLVEARRLDSGDWEWWTWAEGSPTPSGIMAPAEFRMLYTRHRISELGLAPVSSSNIRAIGYDPAAWQLLVEFSGGGCYLYDNVDPALAAPLMAASRNGDSLPLSVGGYFSAYIKPHRERYPFVRLETQAPE